MEGGPGGFGRDLGRRSLSRAGRGIGARWSGTAPGPLSCPGPERQCPAMSDQIGAWPTQEELEATRRANETARLEGGGSNSAPGALTAEDIKQPGLEPEQFPGPLLQEDSSGQVQLVVEGRYEKLSNSITGRTPTSSTLRITGGKVEVGGMYQPGDRVSFLVTVVVDEVTVRDEKDLKTGQVVGRARNHKGAIVGIHEEG